MKEEFKYSYQALTSDEKKEIEKIRDSYIENTSDAKIERIKYLNNKVKKSPIIITTIISCIGLTINGLGVMVYNDYDNVLLSTISRYNNSNYCLTSTQSNKKSL